MPKIITRASWGAARPRSVSRTAWTTTDLWVHHTAGHAPASDMAAEAREMRAIQAFHMGPSRGWSDIGYGFVIAPSGRIYEGRGENVWAAHCPGHNDEPSVCIMGNYDGAVPSEAVRMAVWEMADHLGLTRLRGHREGFPTSCPGNGVVERIVRAPRPTRPAESADPLPYSNTLRLVVNGRAWAGWDQASNPLINIARKGLRPAADAAIAWKGNVWRGPREVNNVAKSLVGKFLL